MGRVTARAIASSSDQEVFDLLSGELQRRLPARDDPAFVTELQKLPPGLRAMAATYELDVSLALDDLGWHFGNWHDEELARETLMGLKELEATDFADIFREAYQNAKAYWSELGADGWTEWYFDSPLSKVLDPLNERAWALWRSQSMGIFSYWIKYARAHPAKVGAVE